MSVSSPALDKIESSSVLSNGWIVTDSNTTDLNIRMLTYFFLVGQRNIRVHFGSQKYLTYRHLNSQLAIFRVYDTFGEFRQVHKSERTKLELETSRCQLLHIPLLQVDYNIFGKNSLTEIKIINSAYLLIKAQFDEKNTNTGQERKPLQMYP